MNIDPLVLTRLREEHGWTQKELAEAAQISPSYMGELEKGTRNPRPPVVWRLAQALDVSMDDLRSKEIR